MNAPYPWLAAPWQAFAARLDDGRLGHAYLLTGREGLGKLDLARAFAALALCEDRRGAAACGACRSCTLYQAGSHPDHKAVLPEDDRRTIGVDRIRELIEFYALKAHYHGRKVALLHPAEMMSTAAANALLKLLEEPPAGALLLLTSHRPGGLPATILRRCQKIKLPEADWDSCLAWLEARRREEGAIPDVADLTLTGAPLAILAQLEAGGGSLLDRVIETLQGVLSGERGVLEAARGHAGDDARSVLDAVELVIRAVIQLDAGHQPRHLRPSAAGAGHLQALANKLHSARLFRFLDRIAEARETLLRSTGVRGTEVIENLLYHWSKATRMETTP